VPGWHERTREHQARGELQLVGIIQEQHPDRCRLFMQWKQMDWPILVDALNLYGVSARSSKHSSHHPRASRARRRASLVRISRS
jgi:hypothetical protein